MNVIQWNSHEFVKCPPGSSAYHPQHGEVRVLSAQGWQRAIQFLSRHPFDTSVGRVHLPHGITTHVVDVRELRLLRAHSRK